MVNVSLARTVFLYWMALTSAGLAADMKPLVSDDMPISDDYILRSWDMFDGLPSNTVNAIAQTPDGYLWLATRNGVARFDGLRFTTFLKKDTPGLESDNVHTAFVAKDGTLWLGLARGAVARFSGGHFQSIVPMEPATERTEWTSSFAEDAGGSIWFGYAPDLSVFRWREGKITTFSSQDGIGPGHDTFVYADVQQAIWFTTSGGLGAFDGHRFNNVNTDPNFWPHVTASRSGGMWVTNGTLLYQYASNGARKMVADLSGPPVTAMYEDRAGDLWIGTRNRGLLRFHQGSLVHVPTSHTYISSITEDREGNLWVGTVGGGIDRLSPRAFSLRQIKDGLLNDSITALCEDSEGKLWLVGIDGTPLRAVDSTNRAFAAVPNWLGATALDLYTGAGGNIWLGTLGGLVHWQNGIFAWESLGSDITALLQDRAGDLWQATIKGQLVCRHDGKDIAIPEDGGLIQPRALAEDSSGSIWVGTEEGLVFQRQNDRFVPVPLPGAKPGEQIRFIVPDVNDTVWIGAYSGGLYCWHAGQVTRLPQDAGLPSEDIRVMEIEPDGNFWFGTGRGLFRVARSEILAVLEGMHASLHATSYGRNDGLPSVDFSFGFRNTVTRTQDGHLWFATYSGALEVDPQKLKKEVPKASVLVEEIQLGGKMLGANGNSDLALPPNPDPLQIHYTLPEMSSPEQIHFRYRLVGLGGGEWVDAGQQRMAAFANLPPGDYQFEVAAAEPEGPWLPGTATISFSVKAAWWQTSLFRIGAAIAAFLAVGWLARAIELRRVRARMLKLEQEHALERERTRIARDIHDELGANLTHISIASHLAQMDPPEAASQHIQDVTAVARNTIKLLGEIVWAVNPRCDTLDALVNYSNQYAANLLSTAGIAYEADIPQKVPAYQLTAEARHHLFLVVKEALNNVVKYAGATTVELKIEIADHQLSIVIADNGCGFEMESVREGGNGLRNMRERMREIGGEFRIESFRGNGTRVALEFPLRAATKQGF